MRLLENLKSHLWLTFALPITFLPGSTMLGNYTKLSAFLKLVSELAV